MSETTRLKLPFIMAAQAQKHITHNEALLSADALIHLSVRSRALAAPPATPSDGDRYVPKAGATGAWAGRAGTIAAFDAGAWRFHSPKEGWRCWVADEGALLVHAGGVWRAIEAGEEVRPALGIGTAPDAQNRLAVKSNAALFSHDDVTPGTGDMRITLNKSAAARDAGLVFQTAYSSRALLGTFGGDAVSLKVSADGSGFATALSAEPSGRVALRGVVDPGIAQPIQLTGAVRIAADRLTVEAASATGVGLHLSNMLPGAHGGYTVSATGAGAFAVSDQANGVRFLIGPTGNLLPGADNAASLGEAGNRFSAVHAATGVIQTSDERDKADVAPIEAAFALAFVDAVEPVTFRWRSASEAGHAQGGAVADEAGVGTETRAAEVGRRHAGFRAQDVRSGLDAAGADLGVWGLDDPKDAGSRQWLRPDQMIPILWAALRETRRELADLRTSIA